MPTMSVDIPEDQVRVLARLLGYGKEKKSALLKALQEIKPHRLRQHLASDLAERAKIPLDEANEVIVLLASLYVSVDRAGESKAKFVDAVCEAAQATGLPELVPPDNDWRNFKAFLTDILSLDSSLGVTAKAHELIIENERLYCTVRIITDLRPVYGPKVDEAPLAALVLHQLKLTFHEGGPETKDFYVTLEKPDVEELRKVLERADRKAESLKAVAKRGGLDVLDG